MREAWYVLVNGDNADPSEVAPDKTGALVHQSGIAVAMRAPDVPHTRGVDVELERAKAKSREANPTHQPPPTQNREMKAESGSKKYKTR